MKELKGDPPASGKDFPGFSPRRRRADVLVGRRLIPGSSSDVALRQRLDGRLGLLDPAIAVIDEGDAAVDLEAVDRDERGDVLPLGARSPFCATCAAG
jgi:hypothetical protein